jgi:hypothetical protein
MVFSAVVFCEKIAQEKVKKAKNKAVKVFFMGLKIKIKNNKNVVLKIFSTTFCA